MPTFRIKMPTDCAEVTGNGNSITTRWGLNLENKKCPAPRSHSSIRRLSICTFNPTSFSPNTTVKGAENISLKLKELKKVKKNISVKFVLDYLNFSQFLLSDFHENLPIINKY